MLSRKKTESGEIKATPLGEAYFALDGRSKDWKPALTFTPKKCPKPKALFRRVRQTRFDLDFICTQSEKNYVYWLEKRGRGIFLRASPIDVSTLLQDKLFDKTETVILTSRDAIGKREIRFHQRPSRIGRSEKNRNSARADGFRLSETGDNLHSESDARSACARI